MSSWPRARAAVLWGIVLGVSAAALTAEARPRRRSGLTRTQKKRYVLDLDGIRKRGVLRVLTRNSSATYFIERGGQHGFQYALAVAFAKRLKVRLRMVVPSSRKGLRTALLQGEGDLIAAGMSITKARAELVRFSRPVMSAARVIAVREGETRPLNKLEDLKDFQIAVNFDSTTYRDARRLEAKLGFPLMLKNIEDDVEMEEMARRLARGEYDAIIIDDDLLDLSRAAGEQVKAAIRISKPRRKGWAFHPGAPKLQAAANRFLARSKRDLKVLHARYYRPEARGAKRARESSYRADAQGHLSPFDNMFQEVGRETGLDWRMLAAVAYTESQFDPKAKSRWGARGLMQVMPKTGRRVGVTKLMDPQQNILAGARYLVRLMDVFKDIPEAERLYFAIAAYNAGLGHIFDARKLARRTRRDPNRWFGQVEQALLLKMNPKWHERTRHGYARAIQTTRYVNSVQTRYEAYVRHVPLSGPARSAGR